MDRTADKEGGCHAIPHCSRRRQSGGTLLIAMLCTVCIVLFASEASAQCTARDVLRNGLTLRRLPQPIPRQFQSNPPSLLRCGRRLQWGRLQIRLPSLTRWMQQVVASEVRLRKFSRDRPSPLAPRKQTLSLLRCRRPNSVFRPILRRWRTFMPALDSWVSDLLRLRSLRNSGSNILTSRWVNFSSEWSRSKRGRASLSF